MVMKNITVSVDEGTYRRARIAAAEAGTSVSALVREFLRSRCQGDIGETGADQLRKALEEVDRSMIARGCTFSATGRVSRDAIHDRKALRQEEEEHRARWRPRGPLP